MFIQIADNFLVQWNFIVGDDRREREERGTDTGISISFLPNAAISLCVAGSSLSLRYRLCIVDVGFIDMQRAGAVSLRQTTMSVHHDLKLLSRGELFTGHTSMSRKLEAAQGRHGRTAPANGICRIIRDSQSFTPAPSSSAFKPKPRSVSPTLTLVCHPIYRHLTALPPARSPPTSRMHFAVLAIPLLSAVPALAGPAAYGICQAGCAAVVTACYSAAGGVCGGATGADALMLPRKAGRETGTDWGIVVGFEGDMRYVENWFLNGGKDWCLRRVLTAEAEV
nr:hypothetical protein CFP56_46739 [Quercus suber]